MKNKFMKNYRKILATFFTVLLLMPMISFAACTGGVCKLDNPLLGNVDSVPLLVGRIIVGVIGLIGALALLMFIYGGFLMMTSAGSDRAKKGKDVLVYATIGLVIVFSAYMVVQFVINSITSAPVTK